jgi:formamidopyrimidine-DNA glycosylase
MIAGLSSGETLVMHLGMTGRFTVRGGDGKIPPGAVGNADLAHDHVSFVMAGSNGGFRIDYNDPRRFGFMDLIESI